MSQEINLYQPVKKRRELSFSGNHVLIALLVVVVGHFIYSSIMLGQYFSLNSQIDNIELQKADIIKSRDEIAQQLDQFSDIDINEEIDEIEHLLVNRTQIYETIQTDMFSAGHGYSGYFVAFARQHIPELWLTNITISRAGRDLLLQGQTSAAHLVPKYLEKLSTETLLKGTNLSDFQLDRPIEDAQRNLRADYIDFTISTQETSEDIL